MERMRRELDVPEDLVVSPDGRHLYALGWWETARSYRPADAFAVFRR